MMVKAAAGNVLCLFLGIFVWAAIWEGGLRVVALVLGRVQHYTDSACPEPKRILTLGESTTADVFPAHSAWPRELQMLLKSSPTTSCYTVINAARPGTNTAFIVSETQGLIERYRPDVIITMMGVNDAGAPYIFDGVLPTPPPEWLRSLKIYRVGFWALGRLTFTSPKREMLSQPKTEFLDKMSEGERRIEEGRYSEAITAFEEAARLSLPQAVLAKTRIAVALERSGDGKRAKELLKAILPEISCPDAEISYLVRLYESDPERFVRAQKLFSDLHLPFRFTGTLNSTERTAFHYQKFQNIIDRNSNIRWVAMTYPNLSPEFLTAIIHHPRAWVSGNDLHLSGTVDGAEYDALFIDRFGACEVSPSVFCGKFGHTTRLGNQLIAKNVERALKAILYNDSSAKGSPPEQFVVPREKVH